MADDPRREVYDDLHRNQLARERAGNRASALKVLGIVFERFRPQSVLDVGCGLGTWLAAARELGTRDICGIDGEWLDPATLDVEPGVVARRDLEEEVDLGRQFDLVISLEVAEHLHEHAADPFVASLVRHGDVVLFSAAIPFQGGHGHVNEQFADYWAERFARHGYRPLDFVRPGIWSDREVLWWLRQNLLVYANDRALERYPALRSELDPSRILSAVLPEVYLAWVGRGHQAADECERLTAVVTRGQQAAQEYEKLMAVLSSGGKFKVTKAPDGRITVTKLRGLMSLLARG